MGTGAALARLRAADWLHLPEARQVLGVLDGDKRRTRVVGGVVRDTLLGRSRQFTDMDMATELLPQEVTARAVAAGLMVYPTGIEHGTVTVRAGTLSVEVTTLREDVETDGRHAQVRFGTDWRRDAARRDFTLNALYADIDGALFDPLGGLADCLARRVRFIGDADTRIAEDRLRVYRFFRFSASHGSDRLDPEGLAACRRAVGTLDRLAAERIGAEMRKMLQLPRIAPVLRVMGEVGLLDWPALAFAHLRAAEREGASPDLPERLALLETSVGLDRLRAEWRLSNDEVRVAGEVLRAARLIAELQLHEAVYRFPALLPEALEVASVLEGWGDAARQALRDRIAAIDAPAFPLTGTDLLAAGMAPGKAVGESLRRLERAWIDSGFTLDREALLERVANGEG